MVRGDWGKTVPGLLPEARPDTPCLRPGGIPLALAVWDTYYSPCCCPCCYPCFDLDWAETSPEGTALVEHHPSKVGAESYPESTERNGRMIISVRDIMDDGVKMADLSK